MNFRTKKKTGISVFIIFASLTSKNFKLKKQ